MPEWAAECPHCHEMIAGELAVTRAATVTHATDHIANATPPSSSSGWLSSSDAIDHGRFTPGTLLGGRYRIVERLGRGGMGEVYRADDLKLGQPVALKFLPLAADEDPARLMQLHTEVRMARQVAHPNVCRVYDIDEADGAVFLSMEYVDGEDLASLLRRIGRFPEERAAEIARQIGAGLAAAHDRGVVHRDLKPSNVMIDGAGRVRLTDFGLAGVSGQAVRAGTPAYMPPEQLAGGEVTARSDIFALGLVMYELFTGRRALEARTVAELIQLHEEGTLAPPSSVVSDLAPEIDRAVMRCLHRTPAMRPASALVAVAALPGGDPLAAARAAGETLSPEMVAAAGASHAISRRAAMSAAVIVAASLLALVAAYQHVLLVNRVPLDRAPAAIVDRTEEMLATLGYDGAGQSSAWGLMPASYDYLLHVQGTSQASDRWHVLRQPWPAAVLYWYRSSPRALVPLGADNRPHPANPPLAVPGEVMVQTDTTGRLLALHAVPPPLDADTPAGTPVWERLFAAAGLSMSAFVETTPDWVPRFYADERRAWSGQYPNTDIPVRVEAATYRGRPVQFVLVAPWSRPASAAAPASAFDATINALAGLIMPTLVISAAILARRNLRLGRGDRRGAAEAAAFSFVVLMAGWLLTTSYVPDAVRMVARMFEATGGALFSAAVLWLSYMALEPFVRRYWPDSLVAWSRVTTGQWRDPRVGRDVLIGVCAGLVMTLAFGLHNVVPAIAGQPEPIPLVRSLVAMHGLSDTIGLSLLQVGSALQAAMIGTFGVVLLRHWLTRAWLAAAVATVCFTPVVLEGMFMPGTPLLDLAMGGIIAGVFVGVILRFGLLASVAALVTHFVFLSLPLTTAIGSWRGATTLWALAFIGGMAALALRLAVRERTGR